MYEDITNIVSYYIAESISCGLLAYMLCFIILYYFEKFIDFGNIKTSAIIKVCLIFIGVQVFYSFLIWPILDVVYFKFMGFTINAPLQMKLANIPYFATIFTIWFFFTVMIKVFIYLNQVKIMRIQLESSLRESKLNTLKGQINPHFMFNSLNNIRGLMLENVEKSREMITRLSEMLRYSLTKNDADTTTIEQELITVDNYIALSKIQFEDRLTYIQNVEKSVLKKQIPPMVIQMLVENAVKHGVSEIKKGGTIELDITTAEQEIFITVKNTGNLIFDANTTKLGLENIRKRLFLIYGENSDFSLSEIDGNVVAQIKIPLE